MSTSSTSFEQTLGYRKTDTKTVSEDSVVKTTTIQTINSIIPPFDLVGFLVVGQSLGSGEHSQNYISTRQSYGNLKIRDSLENTFAGGGGSLSFVPLTEPLRPLPQYGQYDYNPPRNIMGESVCSSYANQISYSLGWVSVAHNAAKPAAGISDIKKGGTGTSYAFSISEIAEAKALANAQGKTYGVDSILLVHGEADATNPDYALEISKLRADYDADIKAITGQPNDVKMFISQQCSIPSNALVRSASTLAAQQLMESDIEHFVALPKYQFSYINDGIHMPAQSERRLGEQFAHARLNLILGRPPSLRPISASLNGNEITVNFEVPVLPLQWTATLDSPHAGTPEWASGKGFEVEGVNGKISINSVSINGSSVVISCASPPGVGARVSYGIYQDDNGYKAGTAQGRHGLLCDSDDIDALSTESILCTVVNNYSHIRSQDPTGIHDRAPFEFVSSPDLPVGTFIKSITNLIDNGVMIYDTVLNVQWVGATRTALLEFKNDHRNYCVQFSIAL